MPEEFCVVCGRTDVPLTDGECADCFARRVTLVTAPPRATIVLCPTCGSRLIRQHWEPSTGGDRLTGNDLTPLLTPHPDVGIRSVRWTELGGSALQREFEGEVRLRLRGRERTTGVRFTVKIEHRTCPDCSRKSGRYYTATIQVRAALDAPRETAVERRDRLDRLFTAALRDARPAWREAMSWREALPEGWDYYLTDTISARALARFVKQRLGADLKESATLWGRKDGHDVYRVTICLRFPNAPPEPRSVRP